MATITVKNIPDDVYARLKERAVRNHRSVNGEIIHCLEASVAEGLPDLEGFLARVDAVRQETSGYLTADLLREARRKGRP